MTKDVSKLTLLILLVLTIIVSVLGTLSVMQTLSGSGVRGSAETAVYEGDQSAGAQVSINVVRPVTGEVTLDIVR